MARWLGGFAACALFMAVGCGDGGPELGTVKGQVTLDGTPYPDALVTFSPEAGGRSSTGTTDASGNFSLIYMDKDGALVGKHKVSVTTIRKAAGEVKAISSDDPAYEQQQLSTGSDAAAVPPAEKIPEKYNAKTQLLEDVKAGSNTIDLKLTSA